MAGAEFWLANPGIGNSGRPPILFDGRALRADVEAAASALLDRDPMGAPPMILICEAPIEGLPSTSQCSLFVTRLSLTFDKSELQAALTIAGAGQEIEPATVVSPSSHRKLPDPAGGRQSHQPTGDCQNPREGGSRDRNRGERRTGAGCAGPNVVRHRADGREYAGFERHRGNEAYRFASLGQERVPDPGTDRRTPRPQQHTVAQRPEWMPA